MSSNNLQFVKNILDRIKEHYEFQTNTDLAAFLNVHPSTVSAWRRRGTLDFTLIFNKCHDMDMNFLIYGQLPGTTPYVDTGEKAELLHEESQLPDDTGKLKTMLMEYRRILKTARDLLSKIPD